MDRRFTPEEVREILAIAAERDHSSELEYETLLTLAELEEAARAAGIHPSHVRAAVADVLSPSRKAIHRTFLGVPVEIRRTRTLSRSLEAADWAKVVLEARRESGKHGVVTELGNMLEWSSDADERKSPVRVVAEPMEGGTRITAERSTWPRSLGITLGAGANIAAALAMGATWFVTGAESNLWMPSSLLFIFAIAFFTIGLTSLKKKGRREAEALERVVRTIDVEAMSFEQVDDGFHDSDSKESINGGSIDLELEQNEFLNSSNRASRTRE